MAFKKPYEPGQKYLVKVVRTYGIQSLERKTPGIRWVLSHDEHGEIEHTDYISANTKERIKERLKEAGFDISKIQEDGPECLSKWINGREVQITTKTEVRNGRNYVVTEWLNFPWTSRASKASELPTLPVQNLLLSLFSDKPQQEEVHPDDLPF